MRKPKLKNIKISCVNGKSVLVTKTYVENVKKQIVRAIKAYRRESPSIAKFYFYGIAEFGYNDDSEKNVLIIKYGDALCALDEDKKNKIYAEVPYRTKPSQSKKKL